MYKKTRLMFWCNYIYRGLLSNTHLINWSSPWEVWLTCRSACQR